MTGVQTCALPICVVHRHVNTQETLTSIRALDISEFSAGRFTSVWLKTKAYAPFVPLTSVDQHTLIDTQNKGFSQAARASMEGWWILRLNHWRGAHPRRFGVVHRHVSNQETLTSVRALATSKFVANWFTSAWLETKAKTPFMSLVSVDWTYTHWYSDQRHLESCRASMEGWWAKIHLNHIEGVHTHVGLV